MLYDLYNILPEELYRKAINLEDIGIHEVAWRYKEILKVIEVLVQNKYVILGGDVYSYKNNTLNCTYDNWYLDKTQDRSLIENSSAKATEYIKEYVNKNGENDYVYSLVIDRI